MILHHQPSQYFNVFIILMISKIALPWIYPLEEPLWGLVSYGTHFGKHCPRLMPQVLYTSGSDSVLAFFPFSAENVLQPYRSSPEVPSSIKPALLTSPSIPTNPTPNTHTQHRPGTTSCVAHFCMPAPSPRLAHRMNYVDKSIF